MHIIFSFLVTLLIELIWPHNGAAALSRRPEPLMPCVV
jgi:hypothetical protein